MVKSRSIPPPPVVPKADIGLADIEECLERQGLPFDRELLADVHSFSAEMHEGQKRKSGAPYVTHPIYVAYLLAELRFDPTSVAVGLLHDVLEDTLTTREVLKKRFGEEITALVDGVTKISRQSYVQRDHAQAETFRKMILASAKDLRVIMVKLADRLHNMMTLEHMKPEARRRISNETLEIYAPIAMRLGMSKVQGDLEDLALYHRYPLQFSELHEKLSQKMRVSKSMIETIRDRLEESLLEAGIQAEISYRVKRYYSIFRKLRRQGIDISQLYDFLAYRVITESSKDCYSAFGTVHQAWRPIPGRFKDYIAMPKPNLYQSLHTTVVGERGQPFEVQIRTKEMDLVAEEGVAAHWRYKGAPSSSAAASGSAQDPNILWLRQLLEWQKEVEDPREFMNALKIDLYPDEVYVFTPKGDVFSFPRGATPLDFAYRIHTDVGHECTGARINGKIEPLRTPMSNGDLVEVVTTKGRRPSRDWLKFVRTSRARSKIRHWLNIKAKKEAEAIGRRWLERELRKKRMGFKKTLEGPRLEECLRQEGLSHIEELYQRIGYGKLPVKQVLESLLDPEVLEAPAVETGPLRRVVDRFLGTGPVTVKGQGDLLSHIAQCCRPVPGDKVIGYVTRGRGITVHSVECPNVRNLLFDPERIIEVEWEHASVIFPVALIIETEDRPGILAKLTEVISKEASNIKTFEAETRDSGRGLFKVVAEVRNRRHLDRLQTAIRRVSGVLDVDRRMSGRESTGVGD